MGQYDPDFLDKDGMPPGMTKPQTRADQGREPKPAKKKAPAKKKG